MLFLNSLYYFWSNYFDSLPEGCFIDVLVICCDTSVKEWIHENSWLGLLVNNLFLQ